LNVLACYQIKMIL